MLELGAIAPNFAVKIEEKSLKLSDFLGKKVILYFYPKDDTLGCTKEACSFRDAYSEIQSEGAVIICVSPDTEASHKKFAEKYSLPFVLISDKSHDIAQAYAVWVEKNVWKNLHGHPTLYFYHRRGWSHRSDFSKS